MSEAATLLPPPPRAELWLHERADLWQFLTKGITIARPPVVRPLDPDRRRSCEFAFLKFCHTYFPSEFHDPNRYHLETGALIERWALIKDPVLFLSAEAGPRGIGKTTLRRLFIIWCILYGHLQFAAIIGPDAKKAEDHIKFIKLQLLTNDRLHEDFPEVTGWVRSFGGDAQRVKDPYEYLDSSIVTPFGWRLAAAGWKSGLSGLNKGGRRPDYILLDDLESAEVSRSDAKGNALLHSVTTEIIGLRDHNRRCLIDYICTVREHGCVSDMLTDPKQYPEWRGRRWKSMEHPPDRGDLWEKALEIHDGKAELPAAAAALSDDDVVTLCEVKKHIYSEFTTGHQAFLKYYAKNKTEMDLGAVVLDPKRIPLHECFHMQSGPRGKYTFACEYQQQPPLPDDAESNLLAVEWIRSKQAREPAGIVPEWASCITATIDIGQDTLHWQMDACDEQLTTAQVVLVGAESTKLNEDNRYYLAESENEKRSLVQRALRSTLHKLSLRFARGLPKESGEMVPVVLVVVDCGGAAKLSRTKSFAWYREILQIAQDFGQTWRAVKGEQFARTTRDRAKGRNWIREKHNNPFNRIDADADEYKSQAFEAWRARPFMDEDRSEPFPGTKLVYDNIPREYLLHQTSEWRNDKGKWDWRPKDLQGHPRNHWWDTNWMSFFAMDYLRFMGVKRKEMSLGQWMKGENK